MRLGLAQINSTVGDLPGNRRRILEAYATLVQRGAQLVIFPELIVCGYPPRDLLFKRRFVPDVEASLGEIAGSIGEVPAIVGTVETNASGSGRPFHNAAAFCHRGRVSVVARKSLLPTYDVFDEDRYFEPAAQATVIPFAGRRIGVTICEDIWNHPMVSTRKLYHGPGPLKQLAAQKCDLMVNLSASPWHNDKAGLRQALVTDAALGLRCPVAYVNAVGGNDELIFDGRSLVSDPAGRVIAGCEAFAEELRVVDLSSPAAPGPALAPSFEQADMADIFAALTLGLRDYAHKSGFTRGLVALSGGIDSAVVGVIAAQALGPENIVAVSLPSAISSPHSKADALALANSLGVRFETIGIAEAVAACEAALARSLRAGPGTSPRRTSRPGSAGSS